MGGLAGILVSLGGPVLARAIGRQFGASFGDLAADAINALAKAFGMEGSDEGKLEERIRQEHEAHPAETEARVRVAEADMASILSAKADVMRAGNEQQVTTTEMLEKQIDKGPLWTWAWLYVWQWFLMAAWAWTIFFAPVANAMLRIFAGAEGAAIASPDANILIWLTGAYLALHMGGHTVLELMRNQFGGMFGGKGGDV